MEQSRKSSTSEVFFDEMREWSATKLRILEKYIAAYMSIRGRSHRCIYYIDGFAGAGVYGNGPDISYGSPVRIAKIAQEASERLPPSQLRCIFTELRGDNFQKLSNSIENAGFANVEIRHGAFLDQLPTILTTIGRAPAIFFIDPFGVKEVTPTDLQPILQRDDTELLINFNSRRLRLMAGFEDSGTKEAGAKLRLVSRLLGDDPFDENPEWLQEYRRLKNWLLWEKWAANRYAERLLNASAQLRYVVPYPVREKLGASPKYYLLFATRSAKPMPVMNDILCLEEDNLFDGVRNLSVPPQLSFFNTVRESELESRLVGLMDDIHSYGMANQNCGRDQIIEHFVFDRPASFKKKHYRNAVDRLVETGRARFGVGPKESAPMTFM